MGFPGLFRGIPLVLTAWLAVLGLGSSISGQPPEPPPPREYDIEIRYRIFVTRNERAAQFDRFVRFLESLGFKKNPGPENEAEDASQTLLSGVIPSAQVGKVLLAPQVKSVLVKPAGFQLPSEADRPIKVRLTLASGLPPDRQRLLARQAVEKLKVLGFKEAVGYDHRQNTRLVGTIPMGQLLTLLQDLRWQPAGWLLPEVPLDRLESPLRNMSPILIVEVRPEDVTAGKEPGPAKPLPAGHEKVAPDLRALAAQKEGTKSERLEIILSYTPNRDDPNWKAMLARVSPGMVIEGRLGPLVTVRAQPQEALRLAGLDIVSTVRFPLPAQAQLQPARLTGTGNREALRAAGLERLHALGRQGLGVRLAVIDADFRGFEKFKGKGLPTGLHYVDLTAERNSSLLPDPFPGDPGTVGHGTQCALAAALAAPGADLTLIRIDPASPHQLQAVARLINGERFYSESFQPRIDDLEAFMESLRQRQAQVAEERQKVLNNFSEDQDSLDKRAAYFKKEAELRADLKTYQDRLQRFLDLQRDFRGLKDIQVVSCSLVWQEGYPLGAASPLSRYFDERPFRAAMWFQSAGNSRGQVWAGLFRDEDDNGVMEFVPSGTPLKPARWTRELNFLGWQAFGKNSSPELPDKARVRLSVQWREAHDRQFYFRPGEDDRYRRPLADLRLLVLRQLDPAGEKRPGDDLEVVAVSQELPQRLDNQPTYAIYEQSVEFPASAAGRYALRVEGRVPSGTRPAGSPTLPALEKSWELWPRIFVNVLDPESRKRGRVVFLDYPTELGSPGVPADSLGLISVGAANLSGQSESYSAAGASVNTALSPKPDVLMLDGIALVPEGQEAAFGTDLAAPLAAGLISTALGAGFARDTVGRMIRSRVGKVMQVP